METGQSSTHARLVPRLLVTAGVALIVFVTALSQWRQILDWAARPAIDAHPYPLTFLMTSPTDEYRLQLTVAIEFTVLVILPLLTYQLVVAGFTQVRRGAAAAVGLTTAASLVAGGAFGWFVILPAAVDRLMRSQSTFFELIAAEYLGFVALTVLAAGIVAALPAVYALASMGVASARWIVWSWAAATGAIAIATALDGARQWPLVAGAGGLLVLCSAAWILVRLATHAHKQS